MKIIKLINLAEQKIKKKMKSLSYVIYGWKAIFIYNANLSKRKSVDDFFFFLRKNEGGGGIVVL